MKPDLTRLLLLSLAGATLAGCGGTLAPIPSGNDRVAINAVPVEVAAKAEPTQQDISDPPATPESPPEAVIAQLPPDNTATTPTPAELALSPGLRPFAEPATVAGYPVFTASIGASLRDSLEQYLQANGWRLSWRAEGSSPGRVRDFRLSEPVSLPVDSIGGLLNQLLVGRGLHATVSNKSKAVLIENDANALPRVKRED